MKFALETLVSGHVFAFMIVFTRLGSGLMMFPGIGESFVSARIRMMFALALSLLLYPVLLPTLPTIPQEPSALIKLVGMEVLVGAFFGSIMRLLVNVLETTGAVIAMNIGLSNAMVLNPTLGSQSALPAAFLGTAAIALVFVTDLDSLLFRALFDTYKVFPVGQPLPFSDMAQIFIGVLSKCFSTSIQLVAPFIIMELLLYVFIGIAQKLMPQIQLFLIVMPAQIWGGMMVVAACIAVILGQWLILSDETVAKLFIR